jgi:hypothetical protein
MLEFLGLGPVFALQSLEHTPLHAGLLLQHISEEMCRWQRSTTIDIRR